jgi:hypothetical protein
MILKTPLDLDPLCPARYSGETRQVRFLSSIRRSNRYVFCYCSRLSGASSDIVLASMICDLPNKVGTATAFNLALYFMTNLRRTPGHFFIFYLFTFMCTLTISMYFRSIGALSRTLSQVVFLCLGVWPFLTINVGHGTRRYFRPDFGHLHWFRYSDKIHASLVPLVKLDQSCGIWIRVLDDQ